MLTQITQLQSFGLLLTLLTYILAKKIEARVKFPLVNTMVIALVVIIPVLVLTGTSYESYMQSASYVGYFVGPGTVCLGLSIYRNIHILKRYALPLLIGLVSGMFCTVLFIGVLCWLFRLPESLTVPFYSKSITTAIAMEITRILGEDPSIALSFVLMTGISGSIVGFTTLKWLRITNPIAQGAALGASSHGMGVSKSLELGETQGAIAGLAMGVTGILSVIVIPLCARLLSGMR